MRMKIVSIICVRFWVILTTSENERLEAGAQVRSSKRDVYSSQRHLDLRSNVWADGVQIFRLGLLGVIQIPAQLHVHPEVGRHSKILRQTERDAGSDALVVGDDFVNALSGHVNELGQFVFLDTRWCQELFDEHFAGMCWWTICGNANHNEIDLRVLSGRARFVC